MGKHQLCEFICGDSLRRNKIENVRLGFAVEPGRGISLRPVLRRSSDSGRTEVRPSGFDGLTAGTGQDLLVDGALGLVPERGPQIRSVGLRYASQFYRQPHPKMPVSQPPCRAFGAVHAGKRAALYPCVRLLGLEVLGSFPSWDGLGWVSFRGRGHSCSIAYLDGGNESPLVDVPRRVIRMGHFCLPASTLRLPGRQRESGVGL